MKILCWNVNGLRAIAKKGFLDWLEREKADIVCLQETKLDNGSLPDDLVSPHGYTSYWADSTVRKGYSGVAIYSKIPHARCEVGLGIPRFDDEGRTLILTTDAFTLITGYFPNGGEDLSRVPYKLAYSDAVLAKAEALHKKGQPLIICGDVNTAHREIDIARPKENAGSTGFLPIERAWVDKLVQAGYVDIFRDRHPNAPHHYTWWSYRANARPKNIGWRIDYFFVSPDLTAKVDKAYIQKDVAGSDHCPIGLELTL